MRRAVVLLLFCGLPARAEPVRVTVGVQLRNVEALNLEQNAYNLSFTYWLRWKGPVDAVKGLRFVNTIDAWALTQMPAYDEPLELADGSRYQRFACEGRFFKKLQLDDYPFDAHRLDLELEEAKSAELELLADPASSVREGLTLPGWAVGAFSQQVTVDRYMAGLDAQVAVSRYRFGLELKRPASVFFLTLAPPLLLVVLCCWAVFFLRAHHVDARVGTVITALLTIVFLDLAYTDDLPYLAGVVMMDQLFNFSYLVLTAMLLCCVAVIRWNDQAQELRGQPAGAAAEAKILRLDGLARRAFPLLYLVGSGLILWLG